VFYILLGQQYSSRFRQLYYDTYRFNNTAVGFYKHTFGKNPLDTMFFLELAIQQFAQQLCYW
jgi:hypothetical protein